MPVPRIARCSIGLLAAAAAALGACEGSDDDGGAGAAAAASVAGSAASGLPPGGTGAAGVAGGGAGTAGVAAAGAAATGAAGGGAGSTAAGVGGAGGSGGAAGGNAGIDAGATTIDAGLDAGSSTPVDAGADAGSVGGDDLCDVGVWDGTTPEVLSLSGNTFAHDPTMIEADGVFYRFWTGDYIPMATSTDMRRWDNAPSVYGRSYPSWSTQWLAGVPGETFNFPWAPDVSYFGGRYHLYSSFSARFGDNVSCITHLTTTDIAAGNWTDNGPVICTEGNESYNAIDADLGLDADGKPWLAFGSFWDGIMAIELDADGNRVGSDITRLAWAREIEAPVLFRRCGYYYLFVTWGLCCPGAGRSVGQLTYRVAVGRSDDILGPYVDRDGVPMLDGGGTLLVQGDGVSFAAAGHSDVIVTGGKIYHLYHGYRLPSGSAELRIVELPFDDEGWPVPGGP